MGDGDIAAGFIVGLILIGVCVVISLILGGMFLWICTVVFKVGIWSWWNAMVIGIFILLLSALFSVTVKVSH